jgi:tetratricopeptide (TPR) repeat protein
MAIGAGASGVAASPLAAQTPVIAQADPEAARVARLVAAADSAWAVGARDSAAQWYAAAVRRHAEAVPPHALRRLAQRRAAEDQLTEAVQLYRAAVRRDPDHLDGRVALARTLAWQGRHTDALAAYDTALQRDPSAREARLGRAQVLAWADRHPEALAAYGAWLAEAPNDQEAARGRALTLAWAGRLAEAEAAYAALLATPAPGTAAAPDVESERGLARVLAWRGDLAASEARWRALVTRDTSDVDAWFGLAEVQQWAGRSAEAARSVARARALTPTRADVRALEQTIRADQQTIAQPLLQHATDSDGNRLQTVTVTMVPRALAGVRWRVTGSHREAAVAGLVGTSQSARLEGRWSAPGRPFTLTAEGGAARLGTRASAVTRGWLVTRASGRPVRQVELGVTASAVPFDETAPLIARGVHTRSLEGDLSLSLPRQLSVGLSGGRLGVLGGTVPNARTALVSSLRWAPGRRTTLALSARGIAWDTLGRGDGYFAPHRFTLLEASGRHTLGGAQGWGGSVEGGVGHQAIRFVAGDAARGTAAVRASVGVHYVARRGLTIEGVAATTSVASAMTQGERDYRLRAFSLRARAPLF